MEVDLRSVVVRILDQSGGTAGTGFLVHDLGLLATCAHVVDSAGSGPGRSVDVAFLDHARRSARVEPEYWRGPEAEDVAFLRLEGPAPEGARALPLGSPTGARGQPFRTFGFPEGKATEGLSGYGEIADPVRDEAGFLVIQLRGASETTRGFSGGPVLVADGAVERVVGMITSITSPDRYGRLADTAFCTPTETLRAVCPTLELSDVCPFRGLEPFDEGDTAFFFGRQAVVERLVAAIRREPRFLAVLGPSGSGKSSVVRAGLLPRLRQGALASSDRWTYVVTRPAELHLLDSGALPGASDDLVAAVDAWTKAEGGFRHLLLVLDQFEEVFTVAGGDGPAIVRALARLLESPLPVTVVITLRDDFYSRLARDAPELMPWLERGLGNVPPTLTRDEIRSIVEGPAKAVGLRFENGLLQRIVDGAVAAGAPDGGDGSAATTRSTVLPLLQFALTQLWERRREGVLLSAAYSDLGGVTGALTQWANDAFYRLQADEQAMARKVFSRLVNIGDEELGLPHSRRRTSFASVARGENVDAVRSLVARLATDRLLITGRDEHSQEDTVEVVHDALLREWALLRQWLREDARFLSWHQEMERRVRAWEASREDAGSAPDEGRLLRARELQEAQRFVADRQEEVGADVRAFVTASTEVWEREQQHLERLRTEAQEGREEAERQRQLARRREAAARLGEMADRVRARLRVDPTDGLVRAIGALGQNLEELPGEPLSSVQASLHAAVRVGRECNVLLGHTSTVTAVAFSPDGRGLVSGSADRTLRIWAADGQPLGPPIVGHEDFVTAVAISPDSRTIASGSADGTVRLWDTEGNPLGPPIVGHEDFVTAVTFSPDGRILASGSDDGKLWMWDLDGNPVRGPLQSDGGQVASVAFSPDGSFLVTGRSGTAGGIATWDRDGTVVDVLAEAGRAVFAVAVSPDGADLAVAYEDGALLLYQRAGAVKKEQTAAHVTGVGAVAFSPDGRAIVTGGGDSRIRLWDRQGVASAEPLVGHEGPVTTVAVSPDGEVIASGSVDKSVRLWHRHSLGDGIALLGHGSDVNRIVIAGMGRTIVSGSADHTLRAWNWAGTQLGKPWEGHTNFVFDVAVSPDGETVASASADRTLRLWDRQGRPVGKPLAGHLSAVNAVAFAPDGVTIASGGADRTVRLWDRNGAQVTEPFAGHEEEVRAVTFGTDGRTIVSVASDRTVRVWDRSGRQLSDPFVGHEEEISAVAVSPDGSLIASAGADRTVRLWRFDGTPIGQPFHGHEGPIRAVAFTPDGRYVLTGAEDRTLRLWDYSGNPVAEPFRGHAGSVWAVVVSPDGQRFVSGGSDGTLRVWTGGSWRDWLTMACTRLRNHPVLLEPQTEAEATARRICEQGGARP